MPPLSRQSSRAADAEPTDTALTLPDSGKELTYRSYGQSDGVPVVLLHGTPGSRLLGDLFDDAAKSHGVRLLVPDRPGYGQSDPWPERSLSDTERIVTAVLDDAGVDSAGLIAFSGGAPHALATATQVPERITRLDIVAGATPPTISESTPTLQRTLHRLARTTPRLLAGLLRTQAWVAARRPPAFVLQQYTTGEPTAGFSESAAETIKADFLEALAETPRGAVTELRNLGTPWECEYERIDLPVSLWHGRADSNVPLTDVRRLRDTIPTARLQILDDTDHLGTLLQATPKALETHSDDRL